MLFDRKYRRKVKTNYRNPKLNFGIFKILTPVVVVLVSGIVGVCYLTIQASNELRQPVEERPIENIIPEIQQKKTSTNRFKEQASDRNFSDSDLLISDQWNYYNETDISNITDTSTVYSTSFDIKKVC